MNVCGKRVALGLLGIVMLWTTAGAAEAGLIPWLYNAIFGPVRTPPYYGAAYYGAYYAPPALTAVPAPWGPVGGPLPPTVSMGCAPCPVPACPPQVTFAPPTLGLCAPICPAPCDGGCPTGVECPTGDCAIRPQPAPAQSSGAVQSEVPKTFAEESNPAPAPRQEPIDEGFRRRESGGQGAGGAVQTEAFKPTDTVIPEKQPAPTKNPGETRGWGPPQWQASQDAEAPHAEPTAPEPKRAAEQSDVEMKIPPAQKGRNKPIGEQPAPSKSEKPSTNENSDAGRLPVPTLKFDEKVTWHVVPTRRRLPLRARFTAPAVVRNRIDRNAGWTTLPAGANLVQK
ncbi:MAG TPA: hypothetical protein EYP14_00145 [Planctomycetaceae bacterium]|nr:hypothetical protein [Planctomycetaceae bacterium]